jgi:hypothetical protein
MEKESTLLLVLGLAVVLFLALRPTQPAAVVNVSQSVTTAGSGNSNPLGSLVSGLTSGLGALGGVLGF